MDGFYETGDLICKSKYLFLKLECNSKCKTCLNESTCITCNED